MQKKVMNAFFTLMERLLKKVCGEVQTVGAPRHDRSWDENLTRLLCDLLFKTKQTAAFFFSSFLFPSWPCRDSCTLFSFLWQFLSLILWHDFSQKAFFVNLGQRVCVEYAEDEITGLEVEFIFLIIKENHCRQVKLRDIQEKKRFHLFHSCRSPYQTFQSVK